MSDTTIPDTLLIDLRDYYLGAPPAGAEAIAGIPDGGTASDSAVRLRNELNQLPSPRLVLLFQDAKRMPSMPKTARVPITMELITAQGPVTPEAHRALAGVLDAWWREIRIHKGENPGIFENTFLHDFLILPPGNLTRDEDREQVTQFRAEAIVTLPEPSLI